MTADHGAAQEWQFRKERGVVPLIKLVVFLALRAGRPAARLLLYPCCLYFLAFSRASRTASQDYLARVLARRPSPADVLRHFHGFASCVLDRVFLLNDEIERFDLDIHGEEIVLDIYQQGAGCFLVGAHLGSFEVLRALGRRHPGLRVSLVMYEENASKTNAVLNAINPALTLDVIGVGRAASMLAVEERLTRGHFIGVLADRGLAGAEHRPYPFLGAPAPFPTGPFRMIALLNRPVVLMFSLYRGGGRYDVYFERLAPPPAAAHGRAAAIEDMMRRYVERLEYYVRLAPYNWFNFYDFWK